MDYFGLAGDHVCNLDLDFCSILNIRMVLGFVQMFSRLFKANILNISDIFTDINIKPQVSNCADVQNNDFALSVQEIKMLLKLVRLNVMLSVHLHTGFHLCSIVAVYISAVWSFLP